MSYVDIQLDDNELYFCRIVAAMRNNPKEDAHVASKKILSGRSEYDTHFIGMCAEFAVAKYYNTLPSLVPCLSGDGNAPDITINGYKCQIKCRDKVGWDFALMSDRVADFQADCGILVYRLSERLYRIQGVISKAKFQKVAQVRDYSYGARLAATPEEFSDPSVLNKRAEAA